MKLPPKDRKDVGNVYSNFDHTYDKDVVNQLHDETTIADHTALNFYAIVWREDGKWYESIWQHSAYIDTLEASTLTELISNACKQYGMD